MREIYREKENESKIHSDERDVRDSNFALQQELYFIKCFQCDFPATRYVRKSVGRSVGGLVDLLVGLSSFP